MNGIPRHFTPLIREISQRKSSLSKKVRQAGIKILDAYHGNMRYLMSQSVRCVLQSQTTQILNNRAIFSETDGSPYSKSQPKILRQLASKKLFPQLLNAGMQLDPEEIIVCPYSSIIMLEAALMSIARPNGIVLCPRGFYKKNVLHIEKFGLTIKCFDVNLEQDGRINPQILKMAILDCKPQLCAVLLTMPGNPLEADYTDSELAAIGQVLVETQVKVIIDAVFIGINVHHNPLTATKVRDKYGNYHLLHHQTLTITGISKGHHAVAPYKIGVATSGDRQWLSVIKQKLLVSFQRETTFLAKAVIEHTPLSYLLKNEKDMMKEQQKAKQYLAAINQLFGNNALQYLGLSKYGPFMLITFHPTILEKAALEDSWQLADMLLATVGINCVAGCRMGFLIPCVRININAPCLEGKETLPAVDELFLRLKRFISEIIFNDLTYRKALAAIGEYREVSINAIAQQDMFEPTSISSRICLQPIR